MIILTLMESLASPSFSSPVVSSKHNLFLYSLSTLGIVLATQWVMPIQRGQGTKERGSENSTAQSLRRPFSSPQDIMHSEPCSLGSRMPVLLLRVLIISSILQHPRPPPHFLSTESNPVPPSPVCQQWSLFWRCLKSNQAPWESQASEILIPAWIQNHEH